MSESEITKVQLVIRKFLFETRDVVKDPQASMEWLSKFRDTLMYQDCEKEPCGYALTLLMEARKFNESQREKIQTRHARKALLDEGIENPSREQIDRKRAEMYSEEETTEGAANERMASRAANASRENGKKGGRPKSITATTPQPCEVSTDGPRQAENEEAVATSPSCGGSAANSYAHDALDSLDDKASDPRGYNTGNVQPSDGPEDGNLEVTTKNQNNGGADAVNRKTTVDCKSSTSAPQQRPWKEIVEKSLGISETDKSGTEKGVLPPNPVPGLLKKRRAAGSPLKPGTDPYPAARSLPKSMAEVSDFACSENLDYDDARLWWEQNFVERKGRDKDGRKITNWRGALIRFCESAKRKRESA